MGYLLLLSQVHHQGNRSEAEKLGLELMPEWDAGITSDSLACLAVLALQDFLSKNYRRKMCS